LSNQEISDRTRLSINSVKTYIRSAYRKIGVPNRAKAILWGVAHDLLPDHVRVRNTGSPGSA
jgi:DNA-binding CsgD family transcriptional regulator